MNRSRHSTVHQPFQKISVRILLSLLYQILHASLHFTFHLLVKFLNPNLIRHQPSHSLRLHRLPKQEIESSRNLRIKTRHIEKLLCYLPLHLDSSSHSRHLFILTFHHVVQIRDLHHIVVVKKQLDEIILSHHSKRASLTPPG